MILIDIPIDVEIERPEASLCNSLSPPPTTIDEETVKSPTLAEAITEEPTVSPEKITAEQLEDSLTATLYMDSSGGPDLKRFELETGLIASQQAANLLGIQYPLPEGSEYSFVILGGNQQEVFGIDAISGMITINPPIDTETTIGDTVSFDFSDEPWFESKSTLIRDLAVECPAVDEVTSPVDTEIVEEDDLPAGTEVSDEMASLIEEVPADPEIASALEVLNSSPTSTFNLLIGILSDFDQEMARIPDMSLRTLSQEEILKVVSGVPEKRTYSLTINIDNQAETSAAASQLPVATVPAATGCNQTMGAFGFTGFNGPTPGISVFGAPPFPADDGFRPQPGPRGQMVLQVAHNEWLKSVTEPGKSSRRRVSEVIGRDTSWPQVSRYVYRDYSEQGLAKGGGPYDSSRERRSEWCGAFAAFCYGGAGLKKYYRKSVLPSTYRLQSYSNLSDAFERDYEDIDPSLRPPLPDRRDITLGGRVIWNPAPQQIIPGDILVMGPQPGASNFKNDYGNHISVVAEVTERGCYTYEGNGLGWIYGMPETDEFGGEGRREHGVIRGFCPFTPYADELSDYAVIYIHRPLEMDYYSAGQAPIGTAPNVQVPDTDGRSESFVGD